MKKKIISIHNVEKIRRILIGILWVFSIVISVYLILAFGIKLNRPYDKKKEKEYQQQLDNLCYSIMSFWFINALFLIILYGPFFFIVYVLKNIIYICLMSAILIILLSRDYRNNKNSRNFLVIVSVWNILTILLIGIGILSKVGFRVNKNQNCKSKSLYIL